MGSRSNLASMCIGDSGVIMLSLLATKYFYTPFLLEKMLFLSRKPVYRDSGLLFYELPIDFLLCAESNNGGVCIRLCGLYGVLSSSDANMEGGPNGSICI